MGAIDILFLLPIVFEVGVAAYLYYSLLPVRTADLSVAAATTIFAVVIAVTVAVASVAWLVLAVTLQPGELGVLAYFGPLYSAAAAAGGVLLFLTVAIVLDKAKLPKDR